MFMTKWGNYFKEGHYSNYQEILFKAGSCLWNVLFFVSTNLSIFIIPFRLRKNSGNTNSFYSIFMKLNYDSVLQGLSIEIRLTGNEAMYWSQLMNYQELTQVINYQHDNWGLYNDCILTKYGSCSSSYFDIYHIFCHYQLELHVCLVGYLFIPSAFFPHTL